MKNGLKYLINNMEEVDLTKVEKIGSKETGCAAGHHVFDDSKTKMQISGGTTTLVSMKCLLCGATVEVDVNWEDKDNPGNTGVNDLMQKYEEDEAIQSKRQNDTDSGIGADFWNKILGK